MKQTTLTDIAEKMRSLDICTFTTVTNDGSLLGRPMSNNSDVKYDGNSYYFTLKKEQIVSDIEHRPAVALAFEGKDHLYICVSGNAELIDDKAAFEEHWVPDLDKWFEQGVDTPGLVLIKVAARYVRYWKDQSEYEWKAE